MPAFWLIAAARAARVAAAAAAAVIAVAAAVSAAVIAAVAAAVIAAVAAAAAAAAAAVSAVIAAVVVAMTDNRGVAGDDRSLVTPHQRHGDRGLVLMQVVSKSLPVLTLETALTWAASYRSDTHFGSLRTEARGQLAKTSQQTSH